jgi:hypothetical protein
VEYAYVNVPITADLIAPDEHGIGRIDLEKLTRAALALGRQAGVNWYLEDQDVDLHPTQKAPGPGERRYPA